MPPGELWAGSPAIRLGVAHRDWPRRRPARAAALGRRRTALTAGLLAFLPLVSAAAGLAVLWSPLRGSADAADAAGRVLLLALPATRGGARRPRRCSTLVVVRLLGLGLREGYHPVRSRIGWQVWATERLMDDARTYLYPLYASLLTPAWLRALGADGRPRTSRPRPC